MRGYEEMSLVQMHINEVKKNPLLGRDEETELAMKASKGDKSARDRLLVSNMRFVIKIAKQYKGRGLELEDLISEGYVGLIEAVNRFDASKGWHFVSYAVWWIRQAMLKAIYDKVRPIRLPANRNNELLKIERVRHEIIESGAAVSEETELDQVASMLGMTKFHVREMLNISREMVSLNKTLGADSSVEIQDTLDSDGYKSPVEEMMDIAMKEGIENAVASLDEKSAKVIAMRYGLAGEKQKSLQEIGAIFNLSKERIRQIEKKALLKLRTPENRIWLEDVA